MPSFLSPNIGRTGRVLRAVWGVLLAVAAVLAWGWRWWAGVALAAFALLAFFEAFRGWCVMRACGVKTRW